MSPLVITLLIVGGIAILIAIAYISHMVENSKLEKARLRAELNDRLRRLADVSDALPGQLMTPALKLVLSRLQLHFAERLLPLDKGNAKTQGYVDELNKHIAQGESIPVRNAPQPIINEAKAKEVRFQLENLHGLITRCAQDRILPANEAKHWLAEIRHMLAQLHIEFFGNLGRQALQQNQPGQARLAFERGVQYLRKQPDPTRYQAALKQLEAQLARANSLVLNAAQSETEATSELTEGLKNMGDDEDWKKKNIYD
ncbi:hypothetical protein [Pseudomonas sp.]|uniref:hypothetical protein n=1 Tax=Pseudomonas sp. TaxID=306 RepID=UPI003D110226